MGNGYYGAIYNNSGTVAVLGGTLVGTKSLNRTDCGIYNKTGTVTIGENDNNVSTTNPSITGAKYGIFNESGTLYFYDGVITGEKGNSIYGIIKDIPENYDTEVSEDGDIEHITLTNSAPNVAKVDDNEFRNLKEAVEYCNKNSNGTTKTITMIKDYTLSTDNYEAVINSGTNVKLDLAGYTVEIKAQKGIKNNGELEIVSQTDENGKIYTKATGINNGNISAINNGGNIILTSGEISSVNSYVLGICNEGTGNVTINGGTIDTNSYGIKNIQNGTVKINSGILKSSSYSISNETSGLVEISGGTINGLSGIINKAEGTVRINDGTIEVSGRDSRLITNEGTGKIEIIDGTVKTYGIYSRGIENNSTGEVIIQGGTVGEYPNTNMGSNQKTIVNKAGTLKITGGTIEVGEYGDNAIYNESGNVEISNAKIKSNSYATATIENKTGTIKITSVEIETTTQYSANYPAIKNTETGSIEIQGGTITNTKGEGISVKKGEVKVLGGTIKSTTSQGIIVESSGTLTLGNNDDEVSTQIPEIVGSTYGVYNNGTFNFYDGKITGAKDQSIYGKITQIPEKYEVIKETNEDSTQTATLSAGLPTAQIGQTVYKSLQLAIDAVEENKEDYTKIEILRDITSNDDKVAVGIIPQNKKIQLDLKGYIISATQYSKVLENAGELEIINSEQTIGTIKYEGTGTKDNYAQIINNTGNIILTGGIISSPNSYVYGIYNEGTGNVTINGGTIDTNSYGIENTQNGTVKMISGTIKTSSYAISNETSGLVEISGGTINGLSGIINKAEGTVRIIDGTIEVSGRDSRLITNEGTGKIEIIDGTVKTYGIYSRGIENNSTGEVIIQGGTVGEYPNTNMGSNQKTIVNKAGTLKITGGTIEVGEYGDNAIYNESGNVEISNAKIKSNSYATATIENKTGTIKITSVEIETTTQYSANYPAIKNTETGSIEIQGGTITNTKGEGISVKKGEVKVLGGTIKSTTSQGIIVESSGTLTLGNNDDEVSTQIPEIVGSTYGVYNSGTFNFYDGKITGAKDQSLYGEITKIPDDYEIILNENEDTTQTAVLGKEVATAQIGQTVYNSLQLAIDAVEENKQEATKIEMLRSVTSIKEEPIGTIPQNKKIQLDLKGYILNSAKNNIAIENAGDLELINSTENIGKIKQSKAGNSSRFNYIINNTGKFKLTSGIINAAEGYTYGINNSEDGKIIIDGGEISGNIDGINTLGETVVNNGSIYGYSFAIKAANSANVTITNGTLTSNTNAVLNEGSGTVTISGGTLNANTIVKNTSSGIINIKDNAMLSASGSGKTAILNEGSGTVNFMGGTITISTGFGYAIDNKTTGKIVISGGFINISGYGGNYGRFIRNYQNGEILITGGTIDTTISNNNGDAIENHNNGIIKITGGKITTRSRVVYNMDSGNVEISGGIHNTLSDYSNAVYNSNYGKVYVKDNATIISIKDTIGTSGSSTTEITGGTIKSTNAGAIYCEQNGIVKIGIDDNKVNQVLPNIVGKTYGLYNASSSSYIYFYDGRVTGETEKSTYGTITIPENYKISKRQNDDGTETATLSILGTNVSKASVNDIYYSSLQEAVNACGTSGEIIILNTLSISENITIKEGTNIIINTNGKTLTYVGNDTFITNNGTLTLTGTGTIKAQSGTLIGGSGKTTIEDTVNTN